MHIVIDKENSVDLTDGSTAKDLADKLTLHGPDQALAVRVNGKTCDLSTPLKEGDHVEFLSFEDLEGKEIYWHTSAHVLAQAVLRLWPQAKPTIGPPIENGFYYDFANLTINDEDFIRIEKEMKKISKENFQSKRIEFSGKEEALENFKDNPYKCEIINEIPINTGLSAYRQGEFFDLCRGPHLFNLGKIKAVKILKTSGAYWRGDSDREMLTRIYAITFPDKKLLQDYLHHLEEAKKRDHKILGPRLDLFSLKEEAPGMPFIHPKGMVVWHELLDYLRKCLTEAEYIEIKTPVLLTRELWERSGHWQNYRENMFTSQIETRDFAIKPMNCPGCMLYYKSKTHSYRDLPLRIAEVGNVHRYEPSGAVSGLFRVRSFHQDDAHIFMKPEDIENEILEVIRLVDKIYSEFGLSYHLELSTRPEKNTIGSDEAWELATNGLKGALDSWGQPYRINEGDGAFYGPKIDFHIKDAINRTWQCGTIQLDMSLPEKFQLEYTAADSSKQRPIMIHRVIYGSIERFFGILIEHFAGKFPLWISPHHVRVLMVADRHEEFAKKVVDTIRQAGLICDIDKSDDSFSKKIRNAQLAQINYILTVGDKEVENQTINLRTRDNIVHGETNLDSFVKTIEKEKQNRLLQSPYSQTQP